ncbi:NAD(P)-dependent oxidoreductase [Bordetella petrii]|jgi:3-hydroxyisobutyrate dehydrogenase-like beta-hydroxyacid dehydrogenase|uniref:NAD(P)-dependent oxidoreductase n=1 Tax=Bordetella petrii TaxID=94624 RepID=UPI000478BD85|nr:NAD(P)-dependent oxidoreductase [Bordetella petrii]
MNTGKDTIGMIGVGLMGHGIATNIVKHGHRLVLLDHPGNQPVDKLLAAGAAKVASPAQVARQANIIILCVTGTPQVEDVLFSPDGLLQGLRPGTVVIDCSTAIPSSTVRIAQTLAEAGAQFLDAPMTRTPKEAAEGRLNLLVGGDRALYDRCLPLLRCYAENISYAGPVGSGHRMKLIHNYVSLGCAAIIAEAAACAQRAGIEPDVLVDILAKGGGGGVALDRMRPFLQSGDDSGLRFSLSNARKDLNYYTTMAEEAGAVHGAASAIERLFELGAQACPPQATVPHLVDVLARGPRET